MLLLVIDPKLDQLKRLRVKAWQCSLERFVDIGSVGTDLVQRWPAQHPAARARVARSFGLIIAVEEEGVALIEGPIAARIIAKNEGLEEPARMREVPFRRRRIRERLDRRIGVR